MNTIIASIFLIVTLVTLIMNYDNGIKTFIIAIFISPVFDLGFTKIEFFLVAAIPVIIICAFKRGFSLNPLTNAFIIFIGIALISTCLAYIKYETAIFQPISLLGFVLRTMFIAVLSNSKLSYHNLIEVMFLLLIVNSVAVTIQLFLPNSVPIFYKFYYTDAMTPLNTVMNYGYFNRAYGLFPTPIFLGAFALVVLSYILFTNVLNGMKRSITILLSMFCGIASLTKTFFLGIAVLLILYFINLVSQKRIKINIKTTLIFIIIVFFGIWFIRLLDNMGLFVLWYLNYLSNPLSSLNSRYSSDVGILKDTLKIIKDNIIIGVGFNIVKNEFTGDSFYYSVLHDGGIIGLIPFIFLYLNMSIKNSKIQKSVFSVIALLLCGMSSVIFFEPIGIIFTYISYIERGDTDYV